MRKLPLFLPSFSSNFIVSELKTSEFYCFIHAFIAFTLFLFHHLWYWILEIVIMMLDVSFSSPLIVLHSMSSDTLMEQLCRLTIQHSCTTPIQKYICSNRKLLTRYGCALRINSWTNYKWIFVYEIYSNLMIVRS